MALRGTVEVCVHLQTFHNVDLNSEGLYRLGVSVCRNPTLKEKKRGRRKKKKQDSKEKTILQNPGIPYTLSSSELYRSTVDGRTVSDSLQLCQPSTICELENTFFSRAFLIRYISERYVLNNSVYFRLSYDVFKDSNDPLVLRFSLQCAQVEDTGRKREVRISPEASVDGVPIYTELACREVILNNASKGINEYFPVFFDSMSSSGFAHLEAMVHTSTVNVTFERPPENPDMTFESFLNSVCHSILKTEGKSELDVTVADEGEIDIGRLPAVVDVLERCRRACLGPLVRSSSSMKSLNSILVELSKESEGACVEGVHKRTLENENDIVPIAPSLINTETNRFFHDDNLETTLSSFAKKMKTEYVAACTNNFVSWHDVLSKASKLRDQLSEKMKQQWKETALDRTGETITREICSVENLVQLNDPELSKLHAKVAAGIRKCAGVRMSELDKMPVEDLEMYEDVSSQPIVFEQQYRLQDEPKAEAGKESEKQAPTRSATSLVPRYDSMHVVVLVHGFMGSSWDLRIFRNYLSILEPDVLCLLSRANENDTEIDIEVMATRLAEEVTTFLDLNCKGGKRLGRLSFVCHSLGSIIARKCLKNSLMHVFLPKLYTFFSLASPHLGAQGGQSMLVNTGMWFMRQWTKAVALNQLSMADHNDIRQTFMYRLSEEDQLHMFPNVVLLSGHQDQYVPYHSARVEYPVDEKAPKRGSESWDGVLKEMVVNIMEKMKPEQITRFDFSFDFDNKRQLDTLIGRAAHIHVLDSPVLILTLLLNYHERYFSTELF